MNNLNLALHDEKMQVMNFLNEIALKYPKAISFAPGRPLETFFDVEGSLELVREYVAYSERERGGGARGGYGALGQYGRTNGMIGELIAKLLSNDEGITVSAADIVVTVGCQEAMCLCLLALCGNEGDVALVADPAYIGISGAAKVLGIDVAPVSCDTNGLDLIELSHTIERLHREGRHPRLLYLCPDFANPTGVTTSHAQREQLLELTRRHQIMILEDHSYNYFSFDHDRFPALKGMQGAEHVIYLGSFSKSIFPGLRLGFIVADQTMKQGTDAACRLAEELSKIKSVFTVNTSPLCQAIAGGLLLRNGCSLKHYVEPRRQALQVNRDAMLDSLAEHFPATEHWAQMVSWNRPAGGFFLTVNLPYEVTEDELLTSAEEYGVLWTPMSYFFIDKKVSNQIRLSFSYVTPEQIRVGIAALARMAERRIRATFAGQQTAVEAASAV